MSPNCGVRTVLGVLCLIFGIAGICVLAVSWQNSQKFNDRLVEAECVINEHRVLQDRCSYQCQCSSSSSSGVGSSTTSGCRTCYRDCYKASVVVTITEITSNVAVFVKTLFNSNDAWVHLQSQYPVGSTTQCYYDGTNPSVVRLTYSNESQYLITGIVLMSICGAISVGWIIWEVYNCYKRNKY